MSARDTISLTFFSADHEQTFSYSRGNREILASLDDALIANKKDLADIAGIAVVLGAGGFTGTRMATTVANTFAYAHNIPVIGITEDEAKALQSLIPRFEKAPAGQYISARYSGEPNIGPPAT